MKEDPGSHECQIVRRLMVPMRDGVQLAASVWLPRDEGPFPIVLVRTAYNRVAGEGPLQFVRRGLGVVQQDVRGRYGSDGDFYPFDNEPDDGLDTLDWLAKQPWCNGSVGMYGASYLAAVQFAVADGNHPALKALSPQFMSGDMWRQAYYCNGVFSLALTFSWLVLEVGSRTSEAAMTPLLDMAKLLNTRPVMTLDERIGPVTRAFRDYASHWARDEYWQARDYRVRLARCRTPVLLTAGWYDYYPNENFRNYDALMESDTPEEIKRQHRVIVGPWPHGIGDGTLGELDFGPEACRESDSTLRWLDTMLHGGRAEDFQAAPIRLFVMGENRWRDEWEWPLARTQWIQWYLRDDGGLSPQTPSGRSARGYRSDPEHPVPTRGGNHSVGPYNPGLFEMCPWGPKDQRLIEERDDVLVYTSEPLEEDLEVTGPVRVNLFVSSSAPDTDFVARLCDVYPEGRSINITEGVLRARFRDHQWDKPVLLQPGETIEMPIDLQPTSNVFKRGHRLRLHVTSSSFPLWTPNQNTGNDPDTDTEWAVADQTVYHGAAHPSSITIPVIPRS